MADRFRVELKGVDELARALKDLPEKIRRRAVRRALVIAARIIRDDAKARAPVLQIPTPYRNRGTVKRRISVRASKFDRRRGDEGVFINVRPIRGSAQIKRFGKAGAKNPNDPFYWRFLEFGTKFMQARPFLGPAARSKGEEAIRKFMAEAIPQIEKLNKPKT